MEILDFPFSFSKLERTLASFIKQNSPTEIFNFTMMEIIKTHELMHEIKTFY
jgi:hypothetical protein